jgi:signal transduction histidine kinase
MELDGKQVLQASVRDITERKQAEAHLAEAHARTRALMESVQAGIILVRAPTGSLSRPTPQPARMAGVEVQDLVGKVCNEYNLSCQAGNCPILDLGQDVDNAERTIRRGRRNRCPVLKTVTRVKSRRRGNTCWRVSSISTDLQSVRSDLERTNEALEESIGRANQMAMQAESANMAKSQFLAKHEPRKSAPHEWGHRHDGLLMDTDLSEEQRRYAEVVESSRQCLVGPYQRHTRLFQIEADRLELETLDFDLRTCMEEFAELLALRAQEKGVEFICAIDPDVHTLLQGDPGRLRQILINLTGNAIKFTSEGEGRGPGGGGVGA